MGADVCAHIAAEPVHELLLLPERQLVDRRQRLSLIAFRQQSTDGAEHLVFVHDTTSSVGSTAVRAREVHDLLHVLEGHAVPEPETERFERLERRPRKHERRLANEVDRFCAHTPPIVVNSVVQEA